MWSSTYYVWAVVLLRYCKHLLFNCYLLLSCLICDTLLLLHFFYQIQISLNNKQNRLELLSLCIVVLISNPLCWPIIKLKKSLLTNPIFYTNATEWWIILYMWWRRKWGFDTVNGSFERLLSNLYHMIIIVWGVARFSTNIQCSQSSDWP